MSNDKKEPEKSFFSQWEEAISGIKFRESKFIHVVRTGELSSLCSMNARKYKWLHPVEAYRKELLVHNELDAPNCPECLEILKLMNIKVTIVKKGD